MGVFDIIKLKKGKEEGVLKPSSLEKMVFNNREEIEKIHEEIEAINISYEKYRKNYKKLVIGFIISVIFNVMLITYVLVNTYLK